MNLRNLHLIIKILKSPFKPLTLSIYFGKIKKGVPYFLPTKSVKFTKQDCINEYNKQKERFIEQGIEIPKGLSADNYKQYKKIVPIKWFGINYTGLGFKTKWSDTDYRFEWAPMLSIVLFGLQLFIVVKPKLGKVDSAIYEDGYWECWLVYENNTDKSLSKVERLKQTMEINPCIWSHTKDEKTVLESHYHHILKKNYKKYIE